MAEPSPYTSVRFSCSPVHFSLPSGNVPSREKVEKRWNVEKEEEGKQSVHRENVDSCKIIILNVRVYTRRVN